jgi:hypothetical protein
VVWVKIRLPHKASRQADRCGKLISEQVKLLLIREEKTKVQKGGKGTVRAEGKVDPAKK